jgi:hypothetical protein
MPTGERRFYMGMYKRQKHKESEIIENQKKTQGGKKRVLTGEALKSQMKDGVFKQK